MTEQFEVTVKKVSPKWWDSFWICNRNKKVTGLKLEDFDINTKVTSFRETKRGLYRFTIETELDIKDGVEIPNIKCSGNK